MATPESTSKGCHCKCPTCTCQSGNDCKCGQQDCGCDTEKCKC